MNQRRVGALLSYLNIFLAIIIQFAYTPIMLRILGQQEFGVYSLSESVISYLGLLNFGFSGSYLKFYSQYKAQNDDLSIKKLNAIYLIVFVIISILICIGGYSIVQNIKLIVGDNFTESELRLTKILMAIMTVNMAVMMPNNAFTSITVAYERFIFAKVLTIFKTVGSPLFALPLLLLGYGSKGMSFVLLFVTVISLILNIYYCLQKLKIGFEFRNLNWLVLKDIFSFSFFVFLWSIVDQLNWQVGKVILANIIGSTAVAVYTIGMQFTTLFMVFSTAISGVFTPQIYNYVYEKDASKKLTELMIKVGRVQFYVVFYIWVAFVIFGKPFINLWAGAEYGNAYFIGLLLMTPIIIALTQNIGIEILRAYNKHQMRTLFHLLLALINIAIIIPLTKEYGEIGCAFGTCISTFISSTVISNYFYSKIIKLNIRLFLKEMLKFVPVVSILLIIGIAIIAFIEIHSWENLIFYISLFSLFYIFIMVKFAFNDYERNLLIRFIK